MIVADRFVFLHLHKSGGSFVNEFLLRFVPDARRLGYHLPRSLTPATHASLPTLGFVVRSPLISFHVVPRSRLRSTCWLPV